jgi:hypothetical protein
MMAYQDNASSPHCCDAMRDNLASGDVAVLYVPKLREYGIRVTDGGSSYVVIDYCPWCGRRLPASLRDEWFHEIERLGLEPDSASVPARYATDEWWRSRHGQ